MITYSDLSWGHSKLYLGEIDTGVAIVSKPELDGMYYIKFSDGEYSEDFYSLPRAKDNAMKYYQRTVNSDLRSPLNTTDTGPGIGATEVFMSLPMSGYPLG